MALLVLLGAFVALGTASSAGVVGKATMREGPRRVTLVNHMDETIWVAASPGNAPANLTVTGWKLLTGHQVTITVPNHWNGRF